MSSSDAAAQTAGQNTFSALASNLKNVSVGKMSVSIADGMARSATVNYTATTSHPLVRIDGTRNYC